MWGYDMLCVKQRMDNGSRVWMVGMEVVIKDSLSAGMVCSVKVCPEMFAREICSSEMSGPKRCARELCARKMFYHEMCAREMCAP